MALAIHVGGSVEGFAELMNQKAEEIGLKNTHFVTPHGLDDPNHYTTAYELAYLTDYALKNEKFSQIVGTKSNAITINGYPKSLNNTNELLGNLNGVYGVKTGFTNNAGRCLVTSVKRNDMDLITVVIGADTKKFRTQDSIKLIEYSYNNYKQTSLEELVNKKFEEWKAINQKRIEVEKGIQNCIEFSLGKLKNPIRPLKTSQIENIQYEINIMNHLSAPVEQNKKIGMITIKLNNQIIDTVEVLSTKEIAKKGILEYFKQNLEQLWKEAQILQKVNLS